MHPGLANVSKKDLRDKLSKMYKATPDAVICFGFKTQFGGGRSTGFALVYDSIEAAKKFEPKHRQARNGLITFNRVSRKQMCVLCFVVVRGTVGRVD